MTKYLKQMMTKYLKQMMTKYLKQMDDWVSETDDD